MNINVIFSFVIFVIIQLLTFLFSDCQDYARLNRIDRVVRVKNQREMTNYFFSYFTL